MTLMTRARGPKDPTASFGLPPIMPAKPRLLLLGSLPSQESLRRQEYYAHPQNAFWRIMAHLCGFDETLPYRGRCAAIKRSGIALWDVLQSAKRQGSLDAAIEKESEKPNPIDRLLRRFPQCRVVGVNGQKAAALFQKHIAPALVGEEDAALSLLTLPSTSPAHAALSLSEKKTIWKKTLLPFLKERQGRG